MSQVATIVLGLLALALVIQLVTGGTPAARHWLSVKFLGGR